MGISTGFFNRFGNQRVVGTDLEIDLLDGTLSVDEENNRVGIGETAPGTKLQVTDTAPYVTLKNSTAENSDGGCEARVIFEDHADATLAQIEGSHSGSSDDTKGKLILSTHTGSSLTTALTIDDEQATTLAGDLTVGGGSLVVDANVTATTNHTTVAAHIDYDATGIIASGQTGQNIGIDVDINSDSPTMVGTVLNTGLDVDLTGGTSGAQTNIGLDIFASGADQNFGAIITGTTADLILGTAGNADLTVLSARDQTTGTTAGKNLSISAGSAVTGGSNNINGGDLILSTGKGDGTGTASMQFRTKVSGTDDVGERMRIHTDGNVGIGDSAPGTMLQIKGANAYLTLQNETAENSDGGCETRLIFEDHGNNALGQIEISHVGSSDDEKGKMVFSTNNDSGLQAALTISEAQNVALAGDLQVSGNNIVDSAGSAGISFDGSGNTQVDGDLSVNGGDIQYGNGQNATMSIAAVSGTNTAGKSLTISGGQSTGNANGGNIIFQSSAAGGSGSSANSLATVFTIENDGDILVPGDIGMTDSSAINDENNNKLLKFCSVGSAVNFVEIENAADGTAPAISVLGDSSNITMSLKPKGTGGVRIFGSTAAAASLMLNEDSDNGTNFMKFQAAANIASNHTYTFPAALPGADRVLQSDSSGQLSWVEASGGSAADDLNLVLHMQVFS